VRAGGAGLRRRGGRLDTWTQRLRRRFGAGLGVVLPKLKKDFAVAGSRGAE
jgi:hypothetical protein